jgi:putative transposase
MALLLIDVLQHYRKENRYLLHEFVIMPNHLHLLLTVSREMSIEKATQLVKGNLSYRAKRELNFQFPIWHRGFSEVSIYDKEAYAIRKRYIRENPVKAGKVSEVSEWEFGSAWPGVRLDPFPEYLRG